MKDLSGKLAVVTGGGAGIGRELARQLAAAGCHVAMCDVSGDAMMETMDLCRAEAAEHVRVTTHLCDVSDESRVLAFRDAVAAEHSNGHINLLFNNAGIGGGGGFVAGDRKEWERTFNICWGGVYNCTRVFMPLLVASDAGCLVNISSMNGFFASVGPGMPYTAYSTAKSAVKGFSEALVVDLSVHAPHVKVVLVMPGHVGTSIVLNTTKIHGSSPARVAEMRSAMVRSGFPVQNAPDESILAAAQQYAVEFRDKAPVTAAQAAARILEGVRDGRWRIVIGEDAQAYDRLVRETPEDAYDPSVMLRMYQQ